VSELNNKQEILDEIFKQIKNKNYKQAEKELIKIIQSKKDNYQAYFLLGIVHGVNKKFEKAIESFKSSISLNNKNKLALYNLGIMLKEVGKIEESNSLFNKALEIDPNYIEANLAVAKFNDEKNNYLQAKKYYEKTLSLDVNNNLANQLYGRFLIKIGEIKKGQCCNYKYSGVIRFNEKDFEII